jgi:threonine/homoserine/homoserine lactone efflux protein
MTAPVLDPSVLPVFLLAVLALCIAPGPDLALIVSSTVARGARAGVWCCVGIAVAGVLQTALVAFGLGELLQRVPVLADTVRWVGAAYLMWIGIGLLLKVRRPRGGDARAPRAIDLETSYDWLSRGLINNLLNPKAVLFFSLFLPQFVTAEGAGVRWQIAALGLILTTVALAFNVGVAMAAGTVRRIFAPGGRLDELGTGVLGVVFVGLALRMVWQGGRAR